MRRESASIIRKIEKVIQERRDRGHDEHLQVGDVQELRDQERGGTERRRRQQIAPIPAAERIAPPMSGRYPARRRIGQATEPSVTVVATPLPETVPSRKPASVTVRPGPAPDCERPVSAIDQLRKNVPAPDRFQDGPVDREEDDVGRRDVERHAEDALERHVERADDAPVA